MTLKVFLTDKYKEVNDTRIFDTLKARITVPQAAAYYGVRIGQNGMCRCPFHSDKTPSMKINETYYYCFGCHSTGDVIDFTARLFNLSPLDAARKLALDFGIDPNTPVCGLFPPPPPTRRYPLPLRFPVSGRRNPSGNGKGAAPPC